MEDNITVEDAEKVIGEGITLRGIENLSDMFTGTSAYFDGVDDLLVKDLNDELLLKTGITIVMYGNLGGNGTIYNSTTEEKIGEFMGCSFTVWDGSKKNPANRVMSFSRDEIADIGLGPNYYTCLFRMRG